MADRRTAKVVVDYMLRSGWQKMARRWFGVVWRKASQIDVRKPLHAVAIGVIVAGVMVPILQYLADEARYRLAADQTAVMAPVSKTLSGKLEYDHDKRINYFNRDSAIALEGDNMLGMVGGGDKKTKNLYSAKMPVDARQGITVSDTAHEVSVTMRPQFGTMDGRIEAGRVLYPLADSSGVLSLTPKANGVKEDVVLGRPVGDRVQLDYELDVPNGLVARVMPGGGVGFYSGDPTLYGNISFSTEADRQSVEKARARAEKTYLMFEIPAPIVRQSQGGSNQVKARFELDGKRLSVIVNGLAKASYPLSIDPTFVITSTSEFGLGAIEDNINTTTADQIGRAAITGGELGTWATTSALPAAGFAFSITAYNGFLYAAGGGNGASAVTYFAAINSDGTLGTWAATTTTFGTGRTAGAMVGWNGFIYVLGGENSNGNTQFATVEYNAVQSNGDITGTWSTGTAMSVSRAYFAAVVYKGVIYAIGGQTTKGDVGLRNTVEKSVIKANGLNGAWSNVSSFTTARDRHAATVYNGYIYLSGGWTGSVASDVQAVSINTDGTLGTWTTTNITALPAARRNHGMAVERGYLYVYGGCTSGTACSGFLATSVYAPVFADGTVGAWATSTSFTTARTMMGTASVNGYLYSVGGCTGEAGGSGNCNAAQSDVQYVQITVTPGNVQPPAATGSLGTARGGNAVTTYNGFIYSIGGCTGATCATFSTVVEKASVGDDGTLTWNTTNMTALGTGRYGSSLSAYNGRLYLCGGTTGTVQNDCLSSTLNTSGENTGAWTSQGTFDTNGRRMHTSALFDNNIYIIGGTDGTNFPTTIRYAPINQSTGAIGTWASTTQGLSAGRYAHGSAIYGSNLYVVGGENSTATKQSTVWRLPISSNGDIASINTDTALPAARSYLSVVASDSVLYVLGGMTGTTATNAIIWATLGTSSASISSWNTSANTLVTSRQNFGAAAYKGYIFAVGGCTSGQACSTYTATTDKGLALNGGFGLVEGSFPSSGTFTTARADAQYVVMNNYLYIVGGCTAYTSGACTTWTTSVQSSLIGPDGTLGTWTANTALTTGRSYGAALTYNNVLYLIGGSISGTAEDRTVLRGTPNSTGTLTWTDTAGDYLPTSYGRNGFAATSSNGYLYVLGGVNGGANKNEVLYTRVNPDASLGDPNSCGVNSSVWCTTTTFTTARKDASAFAYNGIVYLVGGYDGSNALADTQYAAVNTTTGALGTWAYTMREDRAMRNKQVVAGNGYAYFIGNETTNTDIEYMPINLNNTLGNMNKTTTLPSVHTNGGAVFQNGYLYIFGGCTAFSSGNCTTVSNVVERVGQRANARVGHYSKLFDTQVDTAPSQFLLNGSGNFVASIQTASTTDPVLGTAQNINPAVAGAYYLIFALDSTGTNVGIAFNYYTFLALDDSNNGTFPDSVSSNVTDFTIFYHSNPSRRLRHGASFTNSSCNSTPANGCILDTAP